MVVSLYPFLPWWTFHVSSAFLLLMNKAAPNVCTVVMVLLPAQKPSSKIEPADGKVRLFKKIFIFTHEYI